MTFVNTTVIAYGQKIGRSLMVLVHAIAVVFTNVMRLRVYLGVAELVSQEKSNAKFHLVMIC